MVSSFGILQLRNFHWNLLAIFYNVLQCFAFFCNFFAFPDFETSTEEMFASFYNFFAFFLILWLKNFHWRRAGWRGRSSKLVKQYFEAVSKIFNCVPGVFQIFLGSFKMFHCLPGVFQIFPDVHHTVSVLTFLAVEFTKVMFFYVFLECFQIFTQCLKLCWLSMLY